MNSRTRAQQPAHREATLIARESYCLLCGKSGCVPAHFPVHRGMGGGKAGWEWGEWVPLTKRCHDLIDGRLGVSQGIEEERAAAIATLKERAPAFWSHQPMTLSEV